MQLIMELKSVSEVDYWKKNKTIKYLLVGIKNFSLSTASEFDFADLELIKQKITHSHLKLIVNLEKLCTDSELMELELILEQLSKYDIAFYTYSDFGVYQCLCQKGLNQQTIFRAPTYLVNSYDINIYNELNQYVVLGTEVLSEELIDLSKNVKKPVIVDLFVKTECFYSRRMLISNYFKYRKKALDPTKLHYQLKEELREEMQSIIEDNCGTHIFDETHQYLLEETKKLSNVELGIIHTKFLTIKESHKVVSAYIKYFKTDDPTAFYSILADTKIKYAKGMYNQQVDYVKKGEVK